MKELDEKRIVITNEKDLALMKIAQGAIVNNTTFPSGWASPPEDMLIVGDHLDPTHKKRRPKAPSKIQPML